MGEFSESQLILILCSVPAMWSVSSSGECDKFKILIGDKEVPTTDLCIRIYLTTDCQTFVNSFNATFLPRSFVQTNSYSLERPSSIKVEGLLSPYNRSDGLVGISPGARVRWTAPFSEISRAHLKGFLLIWEYTANGTTKRPCRLFEFNSSNEMRLQMMTFAYHITVLQSSAEINFTIYSIPPPRSELKNNPETFVRATLKSFASFAYNRYPGGWEPKTRVETYGNGSIEVLFQLSPPEFNFTEFKIELINSKNPGVVFRNISYIGNVMSFSETHGVVVFRDIPAGSYHIKVYPVDPYRNDEEKCVCCQTNCAYFYTKLFENSVADKEASTVKTRFTRNLEDTVSSEFLSSMAHSREDIFNARAETGTSSDDARADNVIGFREEPINILLIVFSFLLVGMIVLVVCLLCNPKSAGILKKFFIRLCSRVKVDSPSPVPLLQVTEVLTTMGHQLPTLKPKKLYFLSADDHSHHIYIIESLINYLELHCYCNVVYPARAEDIHNFDSPYSWFIKHISSSDHIIFVNSVGAQKLIEANLNKTVYRNRVLGPEGDLFTECVKHFFKDNKARDKVINIFFEGNQNESRYIASSFTFQIPRNLPEFVLKLHSLNLKDKEKYNSRLPLDRDNISSLPGGAELLTALEASKHFELDNPNWLQQNFGEPTSLVATYKSPQLEPASGDSGINEFSPLSVSTNNIHELHTYNGEGDYLITRESQNFDTFLAEYLNTHSNQDKHVFNKNQELPFSVVSVPISSFSHEVNNNHKEAAPATDLDLGTNVGYEKNQIYVNKNEGGDQEDVGVGGAYSKPGNVHSFAIKPPESMSAITNMSAEMANINRLHE